MDHARSQNIADTSQVVGAPAIVAYAMAILSTIALMISSYLAYATFTVSDVAGCGGGSVFDCSHVLHSKWSKVVGIPVSVFAIMTHLALISGLWVTQTSRFSMHVRTIVARIVLLAALAAAAAALYFISLQVFVLDRFCSYCMGAHTCGLVVAALAVWSIPIARRMKGILAAVSVSGIAALAVLQVSSAEPPSYKITPFAPVPDEQSDSNGDDSRAESSDLFSAPGASDSSSEPDDIFAAPVDDEASMRFRTKSLMDSSAQSLAVLSMFPSRGISFASTLLMLGPIQQPSDDPPAPEPATKSQPSTKSDRLVQIVGGSVKLKAVDWPLIGDPDAKHIFVEMFDYTCGHCRATNAAIETAKKTLGADMAVLALPVPMNQKCNPSIKKSSPEHAESCELAELAIAVWRLNSEKFAEFHHWMFNEENVPTYANAFTKASELVGEEPLKAELAKKVCGQYVSRTVELYKRVGGGTIPKMVFKQTAIVGKFTSGDTLTNLIKEYTAAQP